MIEVQVSLATISHPQVRLQPLLAFYKSHSSAVRSTQSTFVNLWKLSTFVNSHKVNFWWLSQSQHAANCPRLASPGWFRNHWESYISNWQNKSISILGQSIKIGIFIFSRLRQATMSPLLLASLTNSPPVIYDISDFFDIKVLMTIWKNNQIWFP